MVNWPSLICHGCFIAANLYRDSFLFQSVCLSYERKLFSFCSGRYEDQYILKFYKDKLHSMPCQNQASDSLVPFTNYSKRQYLANASDTSEYTDIQSTASIAIAKCPKYALPRSTFLALWLLSHINIKHP